jgi:hypothetical protein
MLLTQSRLNPTNQPITNVMAMILKTGGNGYYRFTHMSVLSAGLVTRSTDNGTIYGRQMGAYTSTI